MIIDFDKIEETIIKNFRGGEKNTVARMYVEETNKIMYGKLEAGASIGLHTHETSSEIIYILKGVGKVLYDGVYETISEGLCHYCPKGHAHSLVNNSNDDLIFFAVVPEQ
jgi:quercetin dioxygenase-like cupin family protein